MAQVALEIKQIIKINVEDATLRQFDNDLTELVDELISECDLGEIEPNIPGVTLLDAELDSYEVLQTNMDDADIPEY